MLKPIKYWHIGTLADDDPRGSHMEMVDCLEIVLESLKSLLYGEIGEYDCLGVSWFLVL